MNTDQKLIWQKANKVLSDPDYIIDIFKLELVYVKPEVAKLAGLPLDHLYGRPIYEVLGYSFKDMLDILIRRLTSDERELKINNNHSKIKKVKVKFKNFVFNNRPYRVGRIVRILM